MTSLLDGPRRKALAVFMAALLFYALLIVLFSSIGFGADLVHDVSDESVQTHPDIAFYQNRTQAILDGSIPYLDFDTESPPLIMYLMVPAALMGNSFLSYAVLFSAYVFLTASLIYLLIRRTDEARALRAAAIYLFNPITWATSLIFIQDETIVTLFYVLPILLLIINLDRWAACTAVLGTMTKIFSGVLVPLTLLRQRGEDLRRSILVVVATFLAISLPFAILAGEDFVLFFTYYASQSGTEGMVQGISIWKFLNDAGLTVPGIVLQLLFALATVLILYVIFKRGIDPVRGGLLLLMPFFLFFPKIFTCYFILPFSMVCVLSVRDLLPSILVTVAAVLAFLCQFFESYYGQESLLPSQGLWVLLPIAMSLTIHIIWICLTKRMLDSEDDFFNGSSPSPDTPPRSDP